MKCPNANCRSDNVQPGDRFCGECGQSLNSSTQAIRQTQPSIADQSFAHASAVPVSPTPSLIVAVDFKTAILGGVVRSQLQLADSAGRLRVREVDIPIPSNTAEGMTLRFQSLEHSDQNLQVTVSLQKHEYFGRGLGTLKDNLQLSLPIFAYQFHTGSSVMVPTVDGDVPVTLSAKAISDNQLRLSGMGLPRSGTRLRGDLDVFLIVSDAAAHLYARFGLPALSLLAQFGTSVVEDCFKNNRTPDEWRSQLSSAMPKTSSAPSWDDLFGPRR